MYTCINLTVSLTVTATQASVVDVSTATLEGCGRRDLSVHIYNVM